MMVDENKSLQMTLESLSDKIREKEDEKREGDAEYSRVQQELLTLKSALADGSKANKEPLLHK